MPSSSEQDQEQSKPRPSPPQVFLSSRPPVTQHEASTIDKIVDALIGSETFYLSGTLDLAELDVSNPALFYSVYDTNGDIQTARAISLRKPSVEALDLLHAEADPSPFGQNKELVLDESYRLARELRSDRFNLNFDPTAINAGVLAVISAFVAPDVDTSKASDADSTTASSNDTEDDKDDGDDDDDGDDGEFDPAEIFFRYRDNELVHRKTGVQAKLYKLNSYTTGGHFKKHQDTPKAANHIGTLLFGLPASFSGGELILREPETENVIIDWSKPPSSTTSSLKLPWVFFYSDVEHEILPVTSGHRLTIAYDIFATDTVRYRVPGDPDKLDTHSISLFNVLNNALKDEQFLAKGGKLAFALTYQYPATEMEVAKEGAFDAILKGHDYLLFHTLKALSLTPQVRAVYQPEEFPGDYQSFRLHDLLDTGKTRYATDRFSSFHAQPPAPIDREDVAFFTAPTFMGIDSSRCQSDDEPRIELLTECTEASVDWELIWVKRPTLASWAKASTFAYYGNEPDTTFTYVAGVLIVDVPAIGEGARKRG